MIGFLIFLTFLMGGLGIYLAFYREREEFRQKIDARVEGLLRSEVADSDEQLQILRSQVLDELSPINRFILKSTWGNALYRLIEQADANLRVHQLLLMSLGLCVLGGGVSWWLRQSIIVTLVIGGLLGAAPFWYVNHRRKKRMEQFLEQLPEALDLIIRALRAGHAFASSLSTVATEMPDPIAKEFCKTFEEQNLGLSLKASLDHLTERVPLLDLRLCVTAILIQRETGGNLTEILDNIAMVIRERFKILGQVQVYTAQGKMSGWIVGILPFAVAFYIHMVNPQYLRLLFTHPWGKMMLGFGLTMQAVGVLIIRRIVDIKV
ncbi:MAG: type II secretion system F family protein [Acidobacteria bacterium]|nr:type II secretion system F family protein [Acidobacteriota bacterium]